LTTVEFSIRQADLLSVDHSTLQLNTLISNLQSPVVKHETGFGVVCLGKIKAIKGKINQQ
jgi:hypothetical protein